MRASGSFLFFLYTAETAKNRIRLSPRFSNLRGRLQGVPIGALLRSLGTPALLIGKTLRHTLRCSNVLGAVSAARCACARRGGPRLDRRFFARQLRGHGPRHLQSGAVRAHDAPLGGCLASTRQKKSDNPRPDTKKVRARTQRSWSPFVGGGGYQTCVFGGRRSTRQGHFLYFKKPRGSQSKAATGLRGPGDPGGWTAPQEVRVFARLLDCSRVRLRPERRGFGVALSRLASVSKGVPSAERRWLLC